jgi:hypothetical protein
MRNLVIRAVILFWAGGVLGSVRHQEEVINQKLNSRISKWPASILVGAAAAAILASSMGPNEASSAISVHKKSMNGPERSGVVFPPQPQSGLFDSPSVLGIDGHDRAMNERIQRHGRTPVFQPIGSDLPRQAENPDNRRLTRLAAIGPESCDFGG